MKITKKLLDALKDAIEHAESQSAFAKQLEVDPGCITRYLNGQTKSIDDDVWERLKPILYPHVNI